MEGVKDSLPLLFLSNPRQNSILCTVSQHMPITGTFLCINNAFRMESISGNGVVQEAFLICCSKEVVMSC